jgi:hypothetical protein
MARLFACYALRVCQAMMNARIFCRGVRVLCAHHRAGGGRGVKAGATRALFRVGDAAMAWLRHRRHRASRGAAWRAATRSGGCAQRRSINEIIAWRAARRQTKPGVAQAWTSGSANTTAILPRISSITLLCPPLHSPRTVARAVTLVHCAADASGLCAHLFFRHGQLATIEASVRSLRASFAHHFLMSLRYFHFALTRRTITPRVAARTRETAGGGRAKWWVSVAKNSGHQGISRKDGRKHQWQRTKWHGMDINMAAISRKWRHRRGISGNSHRHGGMVK